MRLICLFLFVLFAALAWADVPGSSDLELLPRFPGSKIVAFQQQAALERIYPQGTPRRISGRLRYEQEVLVQGGLTAVTYELPSTHSGDDVFSEARGHLQQQGAELLYWCQGRECGSSSLWANEVFATSMLYGIDDRQSYALLRLTQPGQDSLLALYGTTRGNRRSYLHVEQLKLTAPLGQLLPTPATLVRQLKSNGELQLSAEAKPEGQWLELLLRSLNLDTALRVSLSSADAQLWRDALVAQGVVATRVELGESAGAALHIKLLR